MVSIVFKLVVCEAHGSGRRSAISRSNRRNVMATRKNFMEKGRRADPIGSNPHSYGLVFSEYVLILRGLVSAFCTAFLEISLNSIRISSSGRESTF